LTRLAKEAYRPLLKAPGDGIDDGGEIVLVNASAGNLRWME